MGNVRYRKREESSKVRRAVLGLVSEVVEVKERNSRQIARIKNGMKHGAAEGSKNSVFDAGKSITCGRRQSVP